MSKGTTSIKHVFKTIVWPRRGLLALGFLMIVFSRLAGMVIPFQSKVLLDDVIAGGDMEMLKFVLITVGIAIIVQAATSFGLTKLLSVEAQRLIAELRSKVQQHIIKLPISYFDNNKSGELVSRIMSDVEGVRNLVGTGFVQLLGGGLTALMALGFMISISPMMTLYVLLPVLVFGLISLKAFAYIRPIFRVRGKINAEVTGRLTETLNGIRVIKGFNAEDQEINSFKAGVDRLFQNVNKSLTTSSLVTSLGALLLGLASMVIMGVGGFKGMNAEITAGDFLSFTVFLGFMIGPIVQMSNIGSQMTEAFAGLDRMEEVFSLQPEADAGDRTQKLGPLNGHLDFKDVSFEYEEEKEVLRGVTFSAAAGSVTALVGSSGSGKTTIAGLASSFLNPTKGEVTIDGVDLSKATLDSYRSQLGVVLQDDFLFEGTIRENILFPRPNASEEDLLNAVKGAHVNEFTDRFDDGLNTTIGERGVKLSGGQRQRVAIARAILADPRILILDEATSNLDTESEAFIQESLAALMVGRTTLVIAHRLSTIRKANQILVVENGEIVERGTHDNLIAKEGRYHQLYTYQARI